MRFCRRFRRWNTQKAYTACLTIACFYFMAKDALIVMTQTGMDNSYNAAVGGLTVANSQIRSEPSFMDNISCLNLMEGNELEIKNATDIIRNHPIKQIPDWGFVNITNNCDVFKHNRQYILNSITKDEENFPIAYSILMYKNVDQVERLLRAIYRPQNLYCIHVDKNADAGVLAGMQAIANCFENVFIASKLEAIVYAGFSRLQADLNCMEDSFQKHSSWRYFINLSGEMFPLKTNLEIVKILKIYNGMSDIEGIGGEKVLGHTWRWKNKYKVEYTSEGRGKLTKTNITNDPPPYQLSVVKGSAYGVFTRAFLRYALHDPWAQTFLSWTQEINSPDEVFWSTLHHTKYNPQLNPPGSYKGDANTNKWMAAYASWPPRDPCEGTTLRGICIPGIKDLPRLISRKELFVNKLLPFSHDYMVLECLDQWLKNKTKLVLPFDSFEYRNLPFVKYRG